MGCETIGKLNGHIFPKEILNFVRKHFDECASMDVRKYDNGEIDKENIKKIYDDTGRNITYSGFIYFNFKGEKRQLFYNYSNCNFYHDLNYYSGKGLENMIMSETTRISLGQWGNSGEIIKSIVSHFGGWYDYNDADDIDFEYIPKNEDTNFDNKPIIHVSMEDIYKKFGAIVIIDK